MILFFIGILILFLALYMLSKGKYDDYIDPLDKGEYPLKNLIPLGLYVMDISKHSYNTKYDRNVYGKLSKLYSTKNNNHYLKIHWSNKVVYLMIVLLLIGLLGIGIEELGSEFIFISIIMLGAALYGTDRDLNERIKRRYRMIRMDFPDFLNKITLLIDAGMTVSRALEKVVTDHKSSRPLYSELKIVLMDVKGGRSQLEAFEDFARRCRTPEISKFISILLQNLRRGNAQLVTILRIQASECWEMRKNEAKKLGEEAGSKLLFPMMIMFVAILLIMLVPAVLQLKGF